jgi:hypothetical protein
MWRPPRRSTSTADAGRKLFAATRTRRRGQLASTASRIDCTAAGAGAWIGDPARRRPQLGFIPSVCISSVALSLTACPLVTAAA